MKIKHYIPTKGGRANDGKAAIGFNRKGGLISFSTKLYEIMKLEAGDQVCFSQSEDEDSQWYVHKLGGGPLTVRIDKEKRNCSMNSVDQVCAIGNTMPASKVMGNFRILVGTDPIEHEGIEYFELIAASVEPTSKAKQ